MQQRARGMLRVIHLHLQRDEDVIPHIFSISLYDARDSLTVVWRTCFDSVKNSSNRRSEKLKGLRSFSVRRIRIRIILHVH